MITVEAKQVEVFYHVALSLPMCVCIYMYLFIYLFTVDSRKLEYRPGRIYAGFPSFPGFVIGARHIPTFWLLLLVSMKPIVALD